MDLKDTIASFQAVVKGDFDHVPDRCFRYVGGIADVERN